MSVLYPYSMAASSSSSAYGGSRRSKYDVFLSFRGEDTRYNFTDHLYAALHRKGINTFKDDERLERGTEISSELTKAIEESRFSIVIFSKDYASSTWCLEELVKIVEFMETNNNHTVIPIFYNVDPSNVRKQKGEFKRAFDRHQQNPKIDIDKIQRWRAALERAANNVGDFISTGRPEAKLVEDIVKDICGRLHISSFDGDQSKYVVGMNYHWERLNVIRANSCEPCEPFKEPCKPCEPCKEPCEPCEPCKEPCEPCKEPCEPCEPCKEPCEPFKEPCKPCEPCKEPCEPCEPCKEPTMQGGI